jgi:glycine dehydrogenase
MLDSTVSSAPVTRTSHTSPTTTPDPLVSSDTFLRRHLGSNPKEIGEMLDFLGFKSLNEMTDAVVPKPIRISKPLSLPKPLGEHQALVELKNILGKNKLYRSFIGMGYYDTFTPAVIQRNIFENPGWYTAYTPYQAEISQGRMEALLNFQTMVADLTGLEIANASLLDEATAAAEAMTMCHSLRKTERGNVFFVSEACHPQTIDVIRTRAVPQGIEVVVGNHETFQLNEKIFGVLLQYPASEGKVYDYAPFIEKVHANNSLAVVAADLLALAILRPPGEFGADIAVGSTQRFGVPMGFGGPHAAYFATRDSFKRTMPGRLIGVSHDAQGNPGYRLALQTREQHIRRDKATSNICTAQVLLAVMASMFAVYHGPEGVRAIAKRVHRLTSLFDAGLKKLGYNTLSSQPYFDTLRIELGDKTSADIVRLANERQINVRVINDHAVGVSFDEAVSESEIDALLAVFNGGRAPAFSARSLLASSSDEVPALHARQGDILLHPVFRRYHTETEMMRYIHRLESRDLALNAAMIPLGSCTMKLNAATEMYPVTWPEMGHLHPFAPADQTRGSREMFAQLESWLMEITGFAGISFQPNAGAQGEYSGLLTIRGYHHQRGEGHRNICLIPVSAHGTNPASAAMAGFKVVPVACDSHGNIDVADLKAKAELHKANLACVMITYPSTHGVYEEAIKEMVRIVHDNGGQVYMDGANMTAQVGVCRPSELGMDVCHLNLHKTFAIPHGGGGPGVGPIGVSKHLLPFLPGHSVVDLGRGRHDGAVSAAPWGSASILVISWAYIAMLGAEGLTSTTKVAVLNANYIARQLDPYFPVLYKGLGDFVAHECIVDLRGFKDKGVDVEDVAKRLMDYGFHAPTMSFPVPGTLMIEPTESESKFELDRFCDAMIAIHGEIQSVINGELDPKNNPLKNAPHTAQVVTADKWERPYSRELAAYPSAWTRQFKFWPSVGRIDNVYGDRNLICTCPPVEEYAD